MSYGTGGPRAPEGKTLSRYWFPALPPPFTGYCSVTGRLFPRAYGPKGD